MEDFNKIVLNIPHASFAGIFSEGSGWNYNAHLINQMMRETDWHTDFMFNGTRDPRVVPVVFGYSRFLVDVERLDDDPLEAEGRGILYKSVGGFLRDTLSRDKQRELLALREAHLSALSREITSGTLLIDCHSFYSDMAKDVDICIGYNDDWSKPDEQTIGGIVSIFESAGYKVGLNTPYSNSITPKADVRYKSLMIEASKRLYLRDYEIELSTRYAPRLSATIREVYDFVLNS